jgi:hypothetical protein
VGGHAPITVSRSQVLAYRVAAHGLDRRRRQVDDLPVLGLGVQDTPPGSARLALSARLERVPDLSGEHSLVWSLRGAPHVHRADDLAGLARQLYPVSDTDAFKRLFDVSPALKRAGWGGLEAFAAAVGALRSVVTRPRPKGEASAAVTAALPDEFSVDCRVCKTRHVREQVFRLATLPAGLELEPGTSPPVLRPRPSRRAVPKRAAGTAGLVEVYLRLNGPAGPDEVAWFLQTSTPVARSVMPDGISEVRIDGRPAWIPTDRLPALRRATPRAGLRLLPPSDGLVRVDDREILVPRAEHREVVYRTLGSPGTLLVDGEIAGTWRARTKGQRIAIDVMPFGALARARRSDLDAEAARVAALRGVDDFSVALTA